MGGASVSKREVTTDELVQYPNITMIKSLGILLNDLFANFYHIAGNFGGDKFWRIWHFDSHFP